MGFPEKKEASAGEFYIDKAPLIHERDGSLPRGVMELNWVRNIDYEFWPKNPMGAVDVVTRIRGGADFCKCQKLACLVFFEYDRERGEYRQVPYESSHGKAKYILVGPVDEYTIYKKPAPVPNEE